MLSCFYNICYMHVHFFSFVCEAKADCVPSAKPFCLWQKPHKAKSVVTSMAHNQAEKEMNQRKKNFADYNTACGGIKLLTQ